eukprot:scaffold21900_cov67-Phaeocystis_antarctica.AAC.1
MKSRPTREAETLHPTRARRPARPRARTRRAKTCLVGVRELAWRAEGDGATLAVELLDAPVGGEGDRA